MKLLHVHLLPTENLNCLNCLNLKSDYGDLLLYNKVRWLSRGKVINRFIILLPEIKQYLDLFSYEIFYKSL